MSKVNKTIMGEVFSFSYKDTNHNMKSFEEFGNTDLTDIFGVEDNILSGGALTPEQRDEVVRGMYTVYTLGYNDAIGNTYKTLIEKYPDQFSTELDP